MANADVIYAIAVQGASDAIAAFNAVNEASKKAAATAHLHDLSMTSSAKSTGVFSESVNKLADSFKMVSRDIGTVGGQAAQTFTHIADEALSVVGILSGPSGMAAGIGIAGLAVGALAAAFSVASDKANEYKGIADRALDRAIVNGYKDAVNGISDAFVAARNEAENYSETAEAATVLGLTGLIEKKQSELFVANDKVTRTRLNAEIGLFTLQLENAKARLKFIADEKAQRDALAESEKEAAIQESAREKAKEKRDKERMQAGADSYALFEKAAANISAKNKKDQDDIDAAKKKERDEEDRLHKEMLGILERDQAQERDAKIKFYKELGDAALSAAEKLKKLKLAEKEAMRAAVVDAGYAPSMFVIGNATSFATGQLKAFGQINRDNWRETLTMTEDKKEAFFAEAQAAIFNMGIQAGTKSIFEGAEAVKEGALMFGAIASKDFPAATLHAKSALTHAASSAIYGTIGVGAVGTSFAVGALHGAPGGGAGGGGGSRKGMDNMPSAPSGGGGGGGSPSGGGAVNITYVYEAGSINAADERATARTVAEGVGNARGSWFERRRMERRV